MSAAILLSGQPSAVPHAAGPPFLAFLYLTGPPFLPFLYFTGPPFLGVPSRQELAFLTVPLTTILFFVPLPVPPPELELLVLLLHLHDVVELLPLVVLEKAADNHDMESWIRFKKDFASKRNSFLSETGSP
jgi:hypothetical protein